MNPFETTSPQEQKEETKKQMLQDISFVETRDNRNRIIGYHSTAPNRKRIVLSNESQTPTPGVPYDVEVLEDTKPDDPLSGKLIVKVVPRAAKLSSKEWKEVEKRVKEGEEFERRRRRASRDIYRKTGITKKERQEMEEGEILKMGGKKRVLGEALATEGIFEEGVQEILGDKESLERVFVKFREKTLREALRDDYILSRDRERLLEERAEIIGGAEGPLSGAEQRAVKEIEKELRGVKRRREELMQSSPEAYYGLHFLRLKRYKKELQRGRIVETPYVEENIDAIRAHFQKNQPILIYGHLGSGKTELALHFAKKEVAARRAEDEFNRWLEKQNALPEEKHAGEKEIEKKWRAIRSRHEKRAQSKKYAHEYSALLVSGSKNTGLADLYGHTILDIDRIGKEETDEYAREVAEKYEKWVENHAQMLDGLSPEEQNAEKDRAHDRILQTYLAQFKEGTISRHFLGPMYRAMEQGRPVIIDEVNAISHEVLISLNHALTRREGEGVMVSKDGRIITVKKGYGVIMTGNLNQGQERYVDRKDMDPAFLSRIYKIPYDYLPQKTEGPLKDEAGPQNELFHLMLAKVMDKNGNIEMPGDTIEKLWYLAEAARVTQNVFAGKEVREAHYFRQEGQTPIPYFLQEQVLSLRALEQILEYWQKDTKGEFRKELDYYIWSEFISQSTVPEDRAYLYQLFKDRFPFFHSSGWEQNPNYGALGNVPDFLVTPPENPLPEDTVFWTARDVVELAYGAAPERARWPK